jgi:hypothetical protein
MFLVLLNKFYYFIFDILNDFLVIDSQKRYILHDTDDCIDISFLNEIAKLFLTVFVMLLHLVQIKNQSTIYFSHYSYHYLQTLLQRRGQRSITFCHDFFEETSDEILKVVHIIYEILTVDKFTRSIGIFHEEGLKVTV